MDSLFTKLSTIENYEEVLAEIVNTAARRFEMKCYMTPKEKHMLLKVCTTGTDCSIEIENDSPTPLDYGIYEVVYVTRENIFAWKKCINRKLHATSHCCTPGFDLCMLSPSAHKFTKLFVRSSSN